MNLISLAPAGMNLQISKHKYLPFLPGNFKFTMSEAEFIMFPQYTSHLDKKSPPFHLRMAFGFLA